MEVTKLWAEHKALITKTAIGVVVALLVIKFFDAIFWGGLLVALTLLPYAWAFSGS